MEELLPIVVYFLDVQHKIHCRYYFLIWEFSNEDVTIHSFWSGKLPAFHEDYFLEGSPRVHMFL
jgi:hypothetical protein